MAASAAAKKSSSRSFNSGVRLGTIDWCHSSETPYPEAKRIAVMITVVSLNLVVCVSASQNRTERIAYSVK